MTGTLASHGFHVAEVRLGQSLSCVNPRYHQQRLESSYHQFNPGVYRADYSGQKLNIDQNKKLVMFGVTHVAAIDGYSGKIIAFETMTIKNNVIIYENIYR